MSATTVSSSSASVSNPSQTSLFQVYLRLRPPISHQPDGYGERFLIVDAPRRFESSGERGETSGVIASTHITLQPPNDSRKRAVERFAFTKVFQENASQKEIFEDTEMASLVKAVLVEGRDGLVATLGVTGSGKSHTILGSKSQRGITQMALDVLFRSITATDGDRDNSITPLLLASLAASDASESQLFSAQTFLEAVYGEPSSERTRSSRAQTPASRSQTPLTVWTSLSPHTLQETPIEKPPSHGIVTPKLPAAAVAERDKAAYPPSPEHKTRQALKPSAYDRFGRVAAGMTAPLCHFYPKGIGSGLAKLRLLSSKEPMPALVFPRRLPQQRPNASPQEPDVSHLAVDVDASSEFVVLVSMYEVYNDRIFDLLSPSISSGQASALSRQGGNGQKDRRRPLLFKSTEGSPDRKLVAGLRKVACATYEEALAILEVGLMERKVAGTGANSVSSRSHGFFCLEVKKKVKGRHFGEETWVGNSLTVVDLAGSERARTAKTAGATLAEAGKINESLMYLGQCLQMQSDFQDGNKTALVPFRQCKLTELLFSNSFPSSSQASSAQNRHPQKAIMIVTADPVGDFNATSQILRYSALAREVTVPRIPSVSETILSGALNSGKAPSTSGRTSPNAPSSDHLEKALAETARIAAEYESLVVRLGDEEVMRQELEIKLKAAQERCLLIEQEVREECWAEMDDRMEEERRRWQRAWEEQAGRNDEHLDKKIELISRGFKIYEDPVQSSDDRVEELQEENRQLRNKIALLERELTGRSPTKKSRSKMTDSENSRDPKSLTKLKSNDTIVRESDIENALRRMDQLKLVGNIFSPATPAVQAPGKKQRKMATRKWDLGPEEDI